MSFSTANGSEDVHDFLQRIKEIGMRRDEEDEERNRKLEEDIIQGRKERQARRAERARSISPTKSSPTTNLFTNRLSVPQKLSFSDFPQICGSGEVRLTSSESPAPNQSEDTTADICIRETIHNPQSTTLLGSPNLSWQRRPDSPAFGSPRNLQIKLQAIHLDGKTRLSDDENCNSESSNNIQKPSNLAHGGSQPGLQKAEPGFSLSSPSRSNYNFKAASSYSKNAVPLIGNRSTTPLTPSQKFDPPSDSISEYRNTAVSSVQGRLSSERLDRSPSPTKGTGGFVQSAMMRRNNSVSKRWSAHSSPGICKVESGQNTVLTSTTTKSSGLSPENSPCLYSRPSSSHSRVTTIQENQTDNSTSTRSTVITSSNDTTHENLSVSTPRHGINQGIRSSSHNISNSLSEPRHRETTPPNSPLRMSDRRRWSPTKSSWLEAALNKPDLSKSKPKTVPPPQQPAWMSEINKAKQRATKENGYSPLVTPKHEVNIGGLMRPPATGGPLPVGNFPAGPTGLATGASKFRSSSVATVDRPDVSLATSSENSPVAVFSTLAGKSKTQNLQQKDFRANLKPRTLPSDNTNSSEPELKNLLGQLRPTKTQNYVAPDELKDNITRGKAALNVTSGPRKFELKDEFKEAILKKKEDFRKAQLEGKGVSRTSSINHKMTLPEALIKQKSLGRSDSISNLSKLNLDLTSRQSFNQHPRAQSISIFDQLHENEPGKVNQRASLDSIENLADGLNSLTNHNHPPVSSVMVQNNGSTTLLSELGPQLTHLTKERDRGPRRRPPTRILVSACPSGTLVNEEQISCKLSNSLEPDTDSAVINYTEVDAAMSSFPAPGTNEIAS